MKYQKHGLSSHPLMFVRAGMKARCYNPNHQTYYAYGGRGIKVCKIWRQDFKAFYDWCIINGWQKGLQIDRINNNGDYKPSNCRFVTCQQNLCNRQDTVFIKYKGETKILSEWSGIIGVAPETLSRRLKKMTVHQAMTHIKWQKTINKHPK